MIKYFQVDNYQLFNMIVYGHHYFIAGGMDSPFDVVRGHRLKFLNYNVLIL